MDQISGDLKVRGGGWRRRTRRRMEEDGGGGGGGGGANMSVRTGLLTSSSAFTSLIRRPRTPPRTSCALLCGWGY
eukprot:747792-Hanusia_phi.AAC.1